MLKIKKVSEIIGKEVYTSDGDFFGQVEEANLVENKVEGWRIRIGSGFMNVFGGAKGVVVPHQFIKAVGDIVIVNKSSLPAQEESFEASPGIASGGSDSDEFI